MTHATLLTDILSAFAESKNQKTLTRKVCGRKGESVTIVAVHGSVIICEGKTGRFPVKETELRTEKQK